MGKIFCLETEWKQTKHDLKDKSSVLSLLQFLENATNASFVFRQVATEQDFEYYIGHLNYDSYNSYDLVYLCFHGSSSSISLANGNEIEIIKFAKEHKGIFKGKNVHFGCCSTLNIDNEYIATFKKLTGARMVSGYEKDVAFFDSFAFELLLVNYVLEHPNYGAKRFQKLISDRLPHFVNKFGFVTY